MTVFPFSTTTSAQAFGVLQAAILAASALLLMKPDTFLVFQITMTQTVVALALVHGA